MKTTKTSCRFFGTAALIIVMLSTGITSCKQDTTDLAMATLSNGKTITELEVQDAQTRWGDGIVNIGRIYLNGGDYRQAATEHIHTFYHYAEGEVLFKPTLASQIPFRTDFEGALSYFVGGNENFPEDHGFAIKPWTSVRWENIGTRISGNIAVAMGQYFFSPQTGGEDVKVEYSFAYIKNRQGELKIIMHGSHIPYTPVAR